MNKIKKIFAMLLAAIMTFGIFTAQVFADEPPPYDQVRVRIIEQGREQNFTITFNGNGGYPQTQTMETDTNGRLATLPTATRMGYTFSGWWTAQTGGTQIDTSHIFSSSTTLYARWIVDGGHGSGSGNGGTGNGGTGNGGGHGGITPTPTPINYSFVSADSTGIDNYVFVQGSDIPLVLNIQMNYSRFVSVRVNDRTLVRDRDFTVERGSTIITLLPNFLETLAIGSHRLEVRFSGNANLSTSFIVAQAEPTPAPEPTPTPTPEPTPMPPHFYDSGELLPFVDVNTEDWFYSPVRFVFCRRLMVGMSTEPMTFAPNATVTRGMVVQVLHNIHGRPNGNGMVNPFTDVAADSWYANAVIWAADMGLVSGFGDGTFRPSDYITRAHLAIILNNYAERMEIELPILRELVPFADYADIRNYARESIERFYMATIISGRPGRIFDPQGNATRAEMASMLQRFLTATEQVSE